MSDKQEILTLLREEFDRWEELLAGLSQEQLVAPQLPENLSIKDVLAHLYAWQQRSIARVEAALEDREPVLPGWPADLDPESEEDVDQINAWIYETYRHEPWPEVYRKWREGFLHFLALSESVPEEALLDPQRYPWLGGRPLSLVPIGAYEHHQEEHLEPLLAWLERGGAGPAG